jgi:hypothetical protein
MSLPESPSAGSEVGNVPEFSFLKLLDAQQCQSIEDGVVALRGVWRRLIGGRACIIHLHDVPALRAIKVRAYWSRSVDG